MRILVCGDFVPINRGVNQVTNGLAFNNGILDTIKAHDLRIVNLEAPVSESLAEFEIVKDGPHLCTPSTSVKYLASSGFNCVTLANNHFCDYGSYGVKKTIEAINTYMGGGKIGAGLNVVEQKKPLDLESEHIKIFNYCESESSVGHISGSNRLDPVTAYYELKEAKENGYFIIVITHGGHEGYQLPSLRMKSLYRYLIDCGASVIINHHQHCYSGYEDYNGGQIFYGLGNFYFDSFFKNGFVPFGWNEGYMVSLDIRNKKLYDFSVIPYEQCKEDNACVRLMSNEEKKNFNESIRILNELISNDSKLSEQFESFAQTKSADIMRTLSPYSNKWLLRFYNRRLLPFSISRQKAAIILNMIRCESLRDVCLSILSKKVNYYE